MHKMGQDTYYELTKRTVPIIKHETASLSWQNSILTVRTNKRLNLLEYSYNLDCLEKSLDFMECSIPSPKDSPATEVCKRPFLKSEMRSVDYTEMIVNSAFWPHNHSLTQEMASVITSKWSPPNFVKCESILAILNNIGGVEFYSRHDSQWKSVLSMSSYIKKALQYNATPRCFEEMKESVYILESSAICWAPELNLDNSCYFVTAQKNGVVLFWQIYSNMNTVKLPGRMATDMIEITRMKWIQKSENKFWLICTDVMGQVNIYAMQVENETIDIQQTYALWPHKDRMTSIGLYYTTINNYLIFLCSKHRHLLVQVIDENGNILSQYLNNVNDHRITDITYTKEGFFLSTVNVKIYKINITYVDSKLNVSLDQLVLKDPYPTHELYGIRFSKNNVVCALVIANRRVLCRKEAHKMELIFISTDSRLESTLPTLLNNPTRKLTHYWDCVELLRFQITKLKITPKIDLSELYTAATNDAYKLKIYLIILIYISNLRKVLRVCHGLTFPEKSTEAVKEKILYLHALSLLNNLYNKCQTDGKLNDLEMETLYGSKNYLEYYSKKYKVEIEIDKNVLNALQNDCVYICQCCDDKIEGFTCKTGHINMFCMQTFTPILGDDYLFCHSCGSTSRADLIPERPLCVFCDLNLVKPS